jgi:cytochrome c biogenesis protein CcmG/thiol:disulfide interchange protein DsbE
MTAPGQASAEHPHRRLKPVQIAAIAVGVVMVLLVVLLVTSKTQTDDASGPTVVGMPAPAVDGKALIGKRFDIGTNDRWLLVNFFATWCLPCAEEHPQLRAFAAEHAKDGKARVVSVVYGDKAAAVKAFFKKNQGTWTVLDSDNGRTALDWRVSKVPESFLVDPDGKVVARFVGGVTQKALDEAIS